MSLKSLIRAVEFRGGGLVMEFFSTQLEEVMATNPMVQEYLKGVVQQHNCVFNIQDSLSSQQSRDQQIVLK